MPLFRRALWPHDHRDELVAGALVGAVVVVLGYASGIGAPAAASLPSAAPPAATAPTPPADSAPTGDPADGSGGAAGTGGLPATGGGVYYPGGGTGVHYPGGTGEDHTGHTGGGTGDTGHSGHGASPTPSDSAPPSSPAPGTTPPTDDATCADGEVRLVRPLLTGVTEPVFGLLGPTDGNSTDVSTAAPAPQPSPCVGLAPLSSLLGGAVAAEDPSPSPEATP
ncbi:hypothetical protein [Streptomyces sp. NPDC057740]|uniref:hypothetical protein n=1 Tax=Streptomyces sp. NPDC057740 TaxID=3346234 RepID=UPI0036C52C42